MSTTQSRVARGISHPIGRHIHFGWLWGFVGFVIIDSVIRNRGIEIALAGLLVGVLSLIGMMRTRDRGHLAWVRIEDPLLAVTAATLVVTASRSWGLLPVFCVAVVGTVGGLAVRKIAGATDYHGGPIYCGTFVGMTSEMVLPNIWWVAGAGLLAGVLWSMSREAWVGIGGKMGTVALGGVLLTNLVASDFHQLGPGAHALTSIQAIAGILVVGLISAPLTWWLAHRRGWGAVLGSAVPTMIFAGVLQYAPDLFADSPKVLTVAWLGASFVGMTAPARVSSPWIMIPIGGVLYGCLQIILGKYLAGEGGIAGATALISVFAIRGGERLLMSGWRLQDGERDTVSSTIPDPTG